MALSLLTAAPVGTRHVVSLRNADPTCMARSKLFLNSRLVYAVGACWTSSASSVILTSSPTITPPVSVSA
jgi:hypothetical protein